MAVLFYLDLQDGHLCYDAVVFHQENLNCCIFLGTIPGMHSICENSGAVSQCLVLKSGHTSEHSMCN